MTLLASHADAEVPLEEHGGPLAFMSFSQIERFASKVDASGSCWLWTGAADRGGYGKFQITTGWRQASGKPVQIHVRAHRLSLALSLGRWPTLCVLHACDNPRCVNPDHLREGTQRENIADCIAKGRRGRKPDSSYLRGDRHPRSKVSEADRARMRERRAAGESCASLSREFGISPGRAAALVSGVRPKHWRPGVSR